MLTLTRLVDTGRETMGVLSFDGIPMWTTLEPTWNENHADMPAETASCIPPGIYPVYQTKSARFGTTYEIKGVPGRSGILFHPGNVWKDTRGCVIVGENFLGHGVGGSKHAFHAFKEYLSGVTNLTITIKGEQSA